MYEEDHKLQEQLLCLLRDATALDAEIEDLYLRLVAPKAWDLAWMGFRRDGRGAVVFDMRGRAWRDQLNQPIDAYYVPEYLLPRETGGDLDVVIEVAVGMYDPQHEMVCIVLYDERVSCSRMGRRILVA